MPIRRLIASLVVATQLLTTACYAYAPVQTTPQAGAQVALEVTDEGRVALSDKIGPGVVRLEGTLAAVEGDELLVDASSVRQVRGYISDLGGVRVRLPKRYVTRMDERRLSRTRSLLVVGGVVAIVAAFFTAKINARSTPGDEEPGGGPDQ
jgi:hypothetical protein